MLLHLAATLLQALFSVTSHSMVTDVPKWHRFFLILTIPKKICGLIKSKKNFGDVL